MSWQEEYLARYETYLRENFNIHGHKRDDGCYMVLTAQSRLADLYPNGMHLQHNGKQWQIYENTREICGND